MRGIGCIVITAFSKLIILIIKIIAEVGFFCSYGSMDHFHSGHIEMTEYFSGTGTIPFIDRVIRDLEYLMST